MTAQDTRPDQLSRSRPAQPEEARCWLSHLQSGPGLPPDCDCIDLPAGTEPGSVVAELLKIVAQEPEFTRLYEFDEKGELQVLLAATGPDLLLRGAADSTKAAQILAGLAAEPWDLARRAPLRFVLVVRPEGAQLALIRHPVAADLPQTPALFACLVPQAQIRKAPDGPDAVTRIILSEFRAALDAPQMTATCDFFDLGGHSLVATRVIGRLARLHGIELRFNDLFSHPTAAALAPLARRAADPAPSSTGPAPASLPSEPAPLSLAQQSLWKIHAALGFGPIFNIPFALRFLDPVDESVFAAAFRDLLERHPGLRCRFRSTPDGVVQEPVAMEDLDRMDWFFPSGTPEDPAPVLASEAAHDFDLARELPLRLRFLRSGETQILSFLFHHLVLDEWSVNLMMDELALAYAARAEGRAPIWARPAAPFPEFARRQAAAGLDRDALAYWCEALRDAPPPRPIRAPDAPPLPDRRAEAAAGAQAGAEAGGGWCEITLEPAVSEGLYALSRNCSASLFNTLYAAISVALQQLAGLDALTIGTSASGRTDPAFFDTIGYFTTVTAHCLRTSDDLTPRALITTVRDQINASLPHSEIPIDLVEAALPGLDLAPGAHMFEVFIQIHAHNKLNGALAGPGGPIRFRQIDPEKSDSVLGLQFEVMEDMIEGARQLRMMMSYRHAHYTAGDVAALVAAVRRVCIAFARPGAADQPLGALSG